MWPQCINTTFNKLLAYIILPEDDSLTQYRKRCLLALLVAGSSACGIMLPVAIRAYSSIASAGLLIGTTSSLSGLTYLLVTKSANIILCTMLLASYGISFFLYDIAGLVNTLGQSRAWPAFILLINLSLQLNLPKGTTYKFAVACILWLICTEAEILLRTGLFETDLFISAERRKQRVCGCEIPPCSSSFVTVMGRVLLYIFIFILDSYFSNHFAARAREEQQRMAGVISATEHIANSLATFDLNRAEDVIAASHLPEPLYNSFTSILQHLREYRPYIPQYCLKAESIADSLIESTIDVNTGPRSSYSLVHEVDERLTPTSASRKSSVGLIAKRNVSFAVFNILGTHASATRAVAVFEQTFATYIATIVQTLNRHNGVVNVVMGDRVHGTFNASTLCAGHETNAVTAAKEVEEGIKIGLQVSCAVSSGPTVCGPMGCSLLKTYATLGPAVVHASVAERFARLHGHGLLCTASVYCESSFKFNCRALLSVIKMKEETLVLYEVMSISISCVEAEWMYQVGTNEWEVYNQATTRFLKGDKDAATKLLLLKKDLNDAEAELLNFIRTGEVVTYRFLWKDVQTQF